MIDNIQCCRPLSRLHQTVPDKHEDQTDVFKHQRFALTYNADKTAYSLRKQEVKDIVNQEQQRNICGGVTKLFYIKKPANTVKI